MNTKIQKTLTILLCATLLLGNISLGKTSSNDALRMTENKNYTQKSNTYKMDFALSSLGDYKSVGGWKFTNEINSTIKDQKLYCATGKSFDIRSEFNLGDEYALSDNSISFDMLLEKGTVSVGIKLVSTVSLDTGIWFHITSDKVNITIGGTSVNEKITHNLSLGTERKYRVSGKNNQAMLYISDGDNYVLVANVSLDGNDNFTIKDGNGGIVGEPVKNVRTPLAGLWKMSVDNLSGYIDNVEYENSEVTYNYLPEGEQRVVDYSSWVATDDLDRITPMQSEAGVARNNKYVGLFYFLNGNNYRDAPIIDVTKEYNARGIDGLKHWLPTIPGGYWAEPYFGYYLNKDIWIYRKHANMFEAAGIDFVFIDISNGEVFEEALPVMLDTWLQIRKEGGQTPDIAFMTGDMPHTLVHDLYIMYNIVYTNPEYKELFFMWEGKPLILGNNDDPNGSTWTVSEETIGAYPKEKFYESLTTEEKEYFEDGRFKAQLDTFTVRKSWAWQARKYDDNKKYAGYWDYLDRWPQGIGRSFKGEIEQMPVGIACLANIGIGRSCVKNNPDYGNGLEDFEFTLGTAKYGYYFEEQFKKAMEVDPKVLMITGWNEWVAGRQTNSFENIKTGHTTTPYYHFVDQFNPEFSRDGEPMKLRDGVGYGDNYYYQMVSFIREFKGMGALLGSPWKDVVSFSGSMATAEDIDTNLMKQWETVTTQYMDTIGDTEFRNYPSYGLKYQYINATGRNDFEYAKVTQDDKFIYFLSKTLSGIITEDSENWMNLYIDSDQDHSTGWEGYDYVINRSRTGKTVSIEKFIDNSWSFETVGSADYLMGTNNITFKVNKNLIGLDNEELAFDFKWADNSTTTGNVMQFMDLGDTAPNDRFNYRFSMDGVVPTKINNQSQWFIILLIAFASLIIVAVVIIIILKKRKEMYKNEKKI